MSDASPTVFQRIAAREIPAEILYEDDDLIAFPDAAPKAPVHLLVVPKSARYANVTELAGGDPGLLARMVAVAQRLADERTDGQYRLIFNTGERAGQTVFHVHAHVLGAPADAGALAEDDLG